MNRWIKFTAVILFFVLGGFFFVRLMSAPDSPAVQTNSPSLPPKVICNPPGVTLEAVGVKPNRFEGQQLLKVKESPPDSQGKRKRETLFRTKFKYPLIRVEETIIKNPSTGAEEITNRKSMVADHLIIKLKDGVGEDALQSLNSKYNAKILKKSLAPNTYIVQFQSVEPDTLPEMMKKYQAEVSTISYAEPDYIESAQTLPNDPSFPVQWGLNNLGQDGWKPDADMDLPEAWNITTGSSDVIVGVIDSGIDFNHPDLAPNIWTNPGEIPNNGIDDDHNGFVDDVHGWDFVHNTNNPFDDRYHGTVVSGVIGAKGNNQTGIAGVCWNVSIVPIKFLDNTGNGADSDAIDAIYYATRLGVNLTNNSWGGGDYIQPMKEAIDDAGKHGILFVAAAGNSIANSDVNPIFPAAYDCENIISVAATDENDNLVWFSNYGPKTVDVGAPGIDIYTTYLDNQYRYYLGTSLAAPQVSGVCALIKSKFPGLTGSQLKNILLKSVDVLPALQGLCVSNGRVNAFNALQLAAKSYFLSGTLAGGRRHTLAVDDEGQVWSIGNKVQFKHHGMNRPINISGVSNIVQVAAGNDFSLALDNNGNVYQWPARKHFDTQPWTAKTINHVFLQKISGLPGGVTDISAGERIGLAVSSNRQLYLWSDLKANPANEWSRKEKKLSPVAGLPSKVAHASAGEGHVLALMNDGTVYSWGSNEHGQLGTGDDRHSKLPVKISLSNMVQVAAGSSHSLALSQDGKIFSWGANNEGQLGFGSLSVRRLVSPGIISGTSNFVMVCAGEVHSIALRSDGSVWSWGGNQFGQVGVGLLNHSVLKPEQIQSLSNIVSIAAGRYHSVALTADGTVYGWGLNSNGQLGINSDDRVISQPVKIPAIDLLSY